jgi:hypothetical protein
VCYLCALLPTRVVRYTAAQEVRGKGLVLHEDDLSTAIPNMTKDTAASIGDMKGKV